jgi:hypothetical protein
MVVGFEDNPYSVLHHVCYKFSFDVVQLSNPIAKLRLELIRDQIVYSYDVSYEFESYPLA